MSAQNDLVIWVQQRLNQVAENVAKRTIQKTGRALPCKVTAVNGSIVTVSFQVTGKWTLPPLKVPKAESEWLRTPTQVGDLGITVPADTFLGGVSGQSSAVADLSVDYGNLSTLVFVPIGNVNFVAMPDANKTWVNGPFGARMGDRGSSTYVECDSNAGTVKIVAAGKTWLFSSAGLTMSTGVVAETHKHGGVQSGGSTTLGPQ